MTVLRVMRSGLIATILSFTLFCYAGQQATSSGGQKPADTAKPAADATHDASDYVGQETCVTCHDVQGKHFAATPMGKAFAHPKTENEKLGCEACHGPGKAHVEAGGGKETIPIRFTKDSKNTAEEKNSACLNCHERGNRLFWSGSPHESRNIACVDCHVGHEPQTRKLTSETRFSAPLTDVHGTKQTQPELCLQCHQMRRAQLQRSSHMPYREGSDGFRRHGYDR